MALTQVRARLGDQWVTLTYNEVTGRYEVKFTAPGTTIHDPGGYLPAEVEITNASGRTESIDADTLKTLRLVVRETDAPTLTLISPPPGWLTTNTPTMVFEATDEEGGSGIDPLTFSPTGGSLEEIPGGYRYTWTPPEPWPEEPRTVTASVSDYDGNVATLTAAYNVDTIPPELYVRYPDAHRVVDVPSWRFTVTASDGESGVESVTAGGVEMEDRGGTWTMDVPLKIGENYIEVSARDAAGNTTTETVYMIRLITDRTPADKSPLLALYQRPVWEWSEAELEWFNTALQKGAYNDTDMNRVGVAVRYLKAELEKRGYAPRASTKIDWTVEDGPTDPELDTYLGGVISVASVQPLAVPEIPTTMDELSIEGANQIEAALVYADSHFPRYVAWTSGETACGAW